MSSNPPFKSDIQAISSLPSILKKAQKALLIKQNQDDGYWCAELLADTTVNADYIFLLHFLGKADPAKIQKLARYILDEQLKDGGWPIYRNGPAELSATVKAYWALKFAGHMPEEDSLRRARRKIEDLGGVYHVNSFSKVYMALFGQYDWQGIPTICPEIMIFPKWFYFNIYEMSAWTRTIVIPLSIVWAKRPVKAPPFYARLDELFPDGRRHIPVSKCTPTSNGDRSWRRFFLGWDSALKWLEGRGPKFIRTWSLQKAEKWILDRMSDSEGLGTVFPAMVNAILALKVLGYPDDHPMIVKELRELEKFEIHRGGKIQMQPCHSPVWDTAVSTIALAASGFPRDHVALKRALYWLLDKEVESKGDIHIKRADHPRGGWFFEFSNSWYPDVDDTAMVILGLTGLSVKGDLAERRDQACLRGLRWVLSMQSKNGGWGSFDRDNTKFVLTKIPFADHNAMIDPPTVDITGRVLEMLARFDYDMTSAVVRRAIDFLKNEQEGDGSWYGRWGVNYIYGTWQVLRGLKAIREDMNQSYVRRAVEWFKKIQHPDGGWGETCQTYDEPGQKGQGPSTPSQTAWGLMALLAVLPPDDPAIRRAVRYLLQTQREDGSWEEKEFTGTGFPKVFYMEYTLYRLYFPLMALGEYNNLTKGRS